MGGVSRETGVLASYESDFGQTNHQDGWSQNIDSDDISYMGSDSGGGYTLIAFLNSDQSSGVTFTHVNTSAWDIDSVDVGDVFTFSFDITVGAANDKWEPGDGTDVRVKIMGLNGILDFATVDVPITAHASGTTTA